jgi:magnesium-transporting ATPase (P-type)
VFSVGLFSNHLLNWSVLVAVALLVALAYVPPLQAAFQTGPLSVADWLYLIAVTPVLLIADEIRKWFLRNRRPAPEQAAAVSGKKNRLQSNSRKAPAVSAPPLVPTVRTREEQA